MCISAPVSFVASAVLLTVGVYAIKQVKHGKQYLFASLPLMFSIQQFSEGIIWLSITHSELLHLQQPFIYIFLTFAEVIWPAAVPISVLLLEKQKMRKLILVIFSTFGLVFSGYIIYCLIYYDFGIEIRRYHIFYTQSFPDTFKTICGVVYVVNCVVSPFISSHKPMRILGLIILASFLITQFLFSDVIISVWCLFAALGSVSVVWTLKKINKGIPKEDY
jgi:uncharacterized membrane protein YqjE